MVVPVTNGTKIKCIAWRAALSLGKVGAMGVGASLSHNALGHNRPYFWQAPVPNCTTITIFVGLRLSLNASAVATLRPRKRMHGLRAATHKTMVTLALPGMQ